MRYQLFNRIRDTAASFAQSLELLSKKSFEGGEERKKDILRQYYVSTVLGGLALLSIIVAFALMVVFAIKNASLL